MSFSVEQLEEFLRILLLQERLRDPCAALYPSLVPFLVPSLDHNESSYYDLCLPSRQSSEESSFIKKQKLNAAKDVEYCNALKKYYSRCTTEYPCNGECALISRAENPSNILQRELDELENAQRSTDIDDEIKRYSNMLERLNEVQIHRDNPYLGLYNGFLVCLNNLNKILVYPSISHRHDRNVFYEKYQDLLLKKSLIESYLDSVVTLIKIYRETHPLET